MAEKQHKPTLELTVVCDDVRVEKGDKISLMGLFDTIFSETVPAIHPHLAVVAAWRGAAGTAFKSEILLVSPDGKLVRNFGTSNFSLQDENQGHRHIAMAYNLNLETFGVYHIHVKLDGALVRAVPLKLEKIEKVQ